MKNLWKWRTKTKERQSNKRRRKANTEEGIEEKTEKLLNRKQISSLNLMHYRFRVRLAYRLKQRKRSTKTASSTDRKTDKNTQPKDTKITERKSDKGDWLEGKTFCAFKTDWEKCPWPGTTATLTAKTTAMTAAATKTTTITKRSKESETFETKNQRFGQIETRWQKV